MAVWSLSAFRRKFQEADISRQRDGTIGSDDGNIDFDDEEAVNAAIGQYTDFVGNSQDGLDVEGKSSTGLSIC
jgi:hypothetical protein